MGRFTSVDPLTASANLKDPQSFNRYSYAMNSPYKFTDPLGLVADNKGGTRLEPTCPEPDGCPVPSLTPTGLEGPAPPTNPDWVSPQFANKPSILMTVDEANRVGNESDQMDALGRPYFGEFHDGIHVKGDITEESDEEEVSAGIGGRIIYWNVQEIFKTYDKTGTRLIEVVPANYTIHVRLDTGHILILKDLVSVSDNVKKLPMGGKLTVVRERRGIKVAKNDVLGRVRTPNWLHLSITTVKNYELAVRDLRKGYGNGRQVSKYFIDPCSTSSPFRCK